MRTEKITTELESIGEYLKLGKNDFFVIPPYQRAYSWTTEECDKLFQDINDFMESENTDSYFFGTVILDDEDDKNAKDDENNFKIIDGQQRTTTFFLLLKALQLRLQEKIKELNTISDVQNEMLELLKLCLNETIKILYKTDDKGMLEIQKDWKLATEIQLLKNFSNNEINTFKDEFQKIIATQSFSDAESKRIEIKGRQKDNRYTNFFRNFKFFYERLDIDSQILHSFTEKFLSKCQIIKIFTNQTDQAIAIFNSLNSKGMPLSDSDIISAQLYANYKNDDDVFDTMWKEFISISNDLVERKILKTDSILQQFMYITRAQDKSSVPMTSLKNYYVFQKENLLKNPVKLCGDFLKIANIWDSIRNFPIIKLFLRFNENAKLFLISYLYRFDENSISEENVKQIVLCLLRLFAVLEVVDAVYSDKRFKMFLLKENEKLVNKNHPIEEITADFKNQIHSKGFWSKEDIKKGLESYSGNTLVFLNEYLFDEQNFDFSEDVNIEHIMPKSGQNLDSIRKDADIANKEEFDSYADKLGNKILLEESINKHLQNDWFRQKKQNAITERKGYIKSRFAIAQNLVNYKKDTWTKTDIDAATEKAVDRILRFIFS